jgi:hypothetical protein
VARPEGVGRALATYELPIEGRDEWVGAETTAQLGWILAPRLPEPDGSAPDD